MSAYKNLNCMKNGNNANMPCITFYNSLSIQVLIL